MAEVKAEAVAKALNDEDAEPFEKPKPEDDFPLQEAFKPLDGVKAAEVASAADEAGKPFEEPKPEENFPLQETFKPLAEVNPEMLEKLPTLTAEIHAQDQIQLEKSSTATVKTPAQEEISQLIIETPAQEEISQPIINASAQEQISQPIIETSAQVETLQPTVDASAQVESSQPIIDASAQEEVETLDDILDKAYDAREKGRVWQAIEFYRKALERYRTDEYAPFVAIDLGNLYKEHALYSKAIKIYEEALTLPEVKRNISVKKEFVRNLEYLRVVRDILLKHRALSTPFGKISNEILQEIDVEFQATRIYSAQKR